MKNKSIFLICLAGILWGTSGLFVNFLAPMGFTTMQMVCMRGTVAAFCMAFYVCIFDRKLFQVTKGELLFSLGSGVAMFGTGAAYYAAIRASSVSTAVILMYTAPVFVMAFSVAFLGEKLTKNKFVAVFFMLVGCALVSGVVGGIKLNFTGVLLGLLSGVAYSAYNIFTKLQMRRNYNPVTSTMYCFIVMAILTLIFANPVDLLKTATENSFLVVPLGVGIGICTSVLPYFLYTISLKYLPVGTASALSIVEPMAATVFSVAILGENLHIPAFIGIIFIIGSVILLSRNAS